jgi:hypothetical protein
MTTIGWILSLLISWGFPSILAVFNPFLAPVSKAIQERRFYTVVWSSYLTGLLRDIILSSPRLGILGLSSLVTSATTYRLSRFLSLEGWQGVFVVAILSLLEFSLDTVFCFMAARFDRMSFFSLWSWKSFFLFVVFSCLWACALGLINIVIRWFKTYKLRRSSS